MEMDSDHSDNIGCNLTCEECGNQFKKLFNKNRHLRECHNKTIVSTKVQRIRCPLCSSQEKFSTQDALVTHLSVSHSVSIKTSLLNFRNFEEFEEWRRQNNREVDYACHRTIKNQNGEKNVYYNCNRNNSTGYITNCNKRSLKSKGSIKIQGTCPSRMLVKILKDESVMVTYVETHVGHSDDLRSKRLSKSEQNVIVQQLNAGVTVERIIQDARQVCNNKIERINVITRGDLAYLTRKYNIDKKRHDDDMVATVLKIEEWNSQGKNYAFLFKQIGKTFPGLNEEDFAVGYMNSIMEKKLRRFSKIICIDGTHGTNRKNWDLTIVLIKDEQNMGFPVAFLLSNRLDQQIQEIFFNALKSRLGGTIDAEYIMSDDDPKYYNAWTRIMCTGQKPRKLLCTWHIVKNWNIQGRAKLKKAENRIAMKCELRKILKETDITIFMQLKENYFRHLEDEDETEFLKYLQRNYFQSEERIMMWAHCYRLNSGINTNMAIESLNKVLKYNTMNGKRNLRVEKLLDLLDELVEEKMWKKIVNTERPNANNYQHKVTVDAHKRAEEIIDNVEFIICGQFKVQSSSQRDKFYMVYYNELCDENCTSSYCSKCKICFHKYKCECPEYSIKACMCKHIHAVALFEERSDSVLGDLRTSSEENNILLIDEPTTSQINYQEDVVHFIEEGLQGKELSCDFETKREIAMDNISETFQRICAYGRSLDEKSFIKFLEDCKKFENDILPKDSSLCKKRKIEKQLYYPSKRKDSI